MKSRDYKRYDYFEGESEQQSLQSEWFKSEFTPAAYNNNEGKVKVLLSEKNKDTLFSENIESKVEKQYEILTENNNTNKEQNYLAKVCQTDKHRIMQKRNSS